MRIGILNHTGTANHLGCLAAMYILESELMRRYGRDVCLERFSSKIEVRFRTRCTSQADFDRLKEDVRADPSLMDRLAGLDLIVLNGEGTLHWPARNDRVWLWLALAELAKAELGVPLWVTNASLFGDTPVFLHCAARAFSVADHVAMRDPASLETARLIGGKQVAQAADFVFLTLCQAVPGVEEFIADRYADRLDAAAELTVIMAGSSALCNDDDLPRWADAYAGVARQLDKTGQRWQALFVAQREMWLDGRLARELAARHRNIRVLDDPLLPIEAAWLMRQADVVVSGRFHVNALAILSDTPALMLPGNTPKNEQLAQMTTGDRHRAVSLDEVTHVLAALDTRPRHDSTAADELRRLARNNLPPGEDEPQSGSVTWGEYARQSHFARRMTQWESDVHTGLLEARTHSLQGHLQTARTELAEIHRSRICRMARKTQRVFHYLAHPTALRQRLACDPSRNDVKRTKGKP